MKYIHCSSRSFAVLVRLTLLILISTHVGCVAAQDRELRGRVKRAETGLPVAQATVVLEELRVPKRPWELPPRSEIGPAVSNENGEFSLTIPSGKYLLIKVLQKKCYWNAHAIRLDMVDLDVPLELTVTAWECHGAQ